MWELVPAPRTAGPPHCVNFMSSTLNPWTSLGSESPFILDDDRSALDAFNQTARASYRVETDLLPEPFVGLVDAPIVLLLLNPGVSDEDFSLHKQADFRDRVLVCHRQEAATYPNYYLHPEASGPGALWTARVLKPLINEFGSRAVASAVAAFEYFPYHSCKFAHHRLRVPSQDFTFGLLRAALRRHAAVFITRGQRIWEEAVPELRGYAQAFTTRSRQNVVISPKNCPDGYEAARAAIP